MEARYKENYALTRDVFKGELGYEMEETMNSMYKRLQMQAGYDLSGYPELDTPRFARPHPPMKKLTAAAAVGGSTGNNVPPLQSALPMLPIKAAEERKSEPTREVSVNMSLRDTFKTSLTASDLALVESKRVKTAAMEFRPSFELYRVIAGHLGWVRCVTVDKSNEWFATGSNDRTIKIWDLASGKLKLTLTGHIAGVRGLVVSDRHPYLFSCGEDKAVKCWDLESNTVIRHYHGHRQGTYAIDVHPELDLIITASRDKTVKVWDIRTKTCVQTLEGHRDTVEAVKTQVHRPHIVSGSSDATVKLWDIGTGRCITTLTHHKKGIRSIGLHPIDFGFTSAAADNIKVWSLPNGEFQYNLDQPGRESLDAGGPSYDVNASIVNACLVNEDNVVVSGTNNGVIRCHDWKTGHLYQTMRPPVQPGTLQCEAAVFALAFDRSGSRLISCDGDKTIKLYKHRTV